MDFAFHSEQLMHRLPDWVARVRFRPSVDAQGEDVIVATLIARSGSSALEDGKNLREASDAVAQYYEDAKIRYWPYVRFGQEEALTGQDVAPR